MKGAAHSDAEHTTARPSSALDQIVAEGAALDAAAVPAGASPAVVADNAQEWARIPAIVGSVLCQVLPQLRPAYSPENCLAWGREMDGLSSVYGWEVGAALAKFGPWAGLVVASLPIVLPTIAAIKEARAAAAGPGPSVTVPAQPGPHPDPLAHPPGMLRPVTE